jgi:hypothetical protein
MTLKEAITGAVKAEIGRQLNSQPLLGNAESSDWHAEGGSLDLSQVADAVIATIAASGTHVVVPVEPTEEMVDAALNAGLDIYFGYQANGAPSGPEDVYRAMLSASLTHSEGEK